MREVYNDPCEHMVETAMADFSKLLWLSVNKNILMARKLKSRSNHTHDDRGKPTLKDVQCFRNGSDRKLK